MNPYQRFFRKLTHLIAGEESASRSAEGRSVIDENELLRLCHHHQIIPLLYHYRNAFRSSGFILSENFWKEITNYTMFNTARVMSYENFLSFFDELATRNRINYRLFKGLVIANRYYPQPVQRCFGDIDILIEKENLAGLHAVLEAQGFQIADDLYRPFPIEIISKYCFARHYIREDSGNIALDVHLNLSGKLHPFQFEVVDFWENHQDIRIQGSVHRSFDDKHQVVYALYHAFKHYYFKLIWMIDLFYILERGKISYADFYLLLRKYGLQNLWRFYLQIAGRLFGRLPKGVNGEIQTISHSHRIINAETVLKGELSYSASRARLLLPLFYLPTFFRKIRYIWRQLFPPRDTLRDFYLTGGLRKNWLNYFRLRTAAMKNLLMNRDQAS